MPRKDGWIEGVFIGLDDTGRMKRPACGAQSDAGAACGKSGFAEKSNPPAGWK